MTILEFITVYFFCAALVSFAALFAIPTKMSPVNNFLGSLMVGTTLGWALWPIFIFVSVRAAALPKE